MDQKYYCLSAAAAVAAAVDGAARVPTTPSTSQADLTEPKKEQDYTPGNSADKIEHLSSCEKKVEVKIGYLIHNHIESAYF